jgi:hypothetical protein
MRAVLILAATALAGCAVATTGVVPRAEGLNVITRQGSSFLVQPMELTAAASREAVAFCAASNKQAKIVHTKEIPAGPLGRWPESEILFRCE